MALFAYLINNEVVKKAELTTDEEFQVAFSEADLLIDITNLIIPPQIGWILSGNTLVPSPGQEVSFVDALKYKLAELQAVAPEILIEMYAQNTILGITTAQADQMFDDFHDVLTRIKEGAWPTALYRLMQKEPMGFVTQEMLDNWIAMLQARIALHLGGQ